MVAKLNQPVPLSPPHAGFHAVDPDTGLFSQQALNQLTAMWAYLNGNTLIIPCSAAGTNIIRLTPLISSPRFSPTTQASNYVFSTTYCFTAAATSTGLVTGLVQGYQTLNVYKNNGAAQATTGDIVNGLQYFWTFSDSLNGGAGGFVLR